MTPTTSYRFLQALDVLLLRGNKLFGNPGSHGEALIPPWPSVAAGALRSRMLADDRVDLQAFARGAVAHPTLGTPRQPGSFAIVHFSLARLNALGVAEVLTPVPQDLFVAHGKDGVASARLLRPHTPPAAVQTSARTPMLAVLSQAERSKNIPGYWLDATGLGQYLDGKTPASTTLIRPGDLWAIDTRIGVGLDAGTGSVLEGRLFSTQAIALRPDVGFIAGACGAILPVGGTVRLGGDGRGAAISSAPVQAPPRVPLDTLARERRARIILKSPGLFTGGWLPDAIAQNSQGELHLASGGVRARLVAAAVARHETVSGWDLAHNQPKPAHQAAPAGSVYWLDDLQGSPAALGKLAESGLWPADSDTASHTTRRVEGFNQFHWARWV